MWHRLDNVGHYSSRIGSFDGTARSAPSDREKSSPKVFLLFKGVQWHPMNVICLPHYSQRGGHQVCGTFNVVSRPSLLYMGYDVY